MATVQPMLANTTETILSLFIVLLRGGLSVIDSAPVPALIVLRRMH